MKLNIKNVEIIKHSYGDKIYITPDYETAEEYTQLDEIFKDYRNILILPF